MSDRNDWIPPEPGEPDVDDDAGLLLFDPNEAVPDVEFEGATQEGHGSPLTTRMIVGAGVGIGVIAVLALLLTRGPDAGEAAPEPTTAIPVPPAAVRGTIILPVPDSLATGAVGTAVDLSFRVTSGTGVALRDTTLTFEVESGSGEVVEVTAVTDERGIASTSVALPSRPGTTVVRATLADSAVAPGRMTVRAQAGAPARIRAVSGNGQEVPIGELLPNRVVVVVTDEAGNPVPNAEVQFSVEPRYGLAAPTRTRTDERGRASALWRVGNAPGTQRLSAISSARLEIVTFTATGRGGRGCESRQPASRDGSRERDAEPAGGRVEPRLRDPRRHGEVPRRKRAGSDGWQRKHQLRRPHGRRLALVRPRRGGRRELLGRQRRRSAR
jgi:hypothetical protein